MFWSEQGTGSMCESSEATPHLDGGRIGEPCTSREARMTSGESQASRTLVVTVPPAEVEETTTRQVNSR